MRSVLKCARACLGFTLPLQFRPLRACEREGLRSPWRQAALLGHRLTVEDRATFSQALVHAPSHSYSCPSLRKPADALLHEALSLHILCSSVALHLVHCRNHFMVCCNDETRVRLLFQVVVCFTSHLHFSGGLYLLNHLTGEQAGMPTRGNCGKAFLAHASPSTTSCSAYPSYLNTYMKASLDTRNMPKCIYTHCAAYEHADFAIGVWHPP